MVTTDIMKKSSLAKHEQFLKWEKKKIDREVQLQILARAQEITETLIDIGINDRNPQALNSLLDRAFGKARQNIGLDGGADDKPIVFMPAQLIQKYAINEGGADGAAPSEEEEPPTVYEAAPEEQDVDTP